MDDRIRFRPRGVVRRTAALLSPAGLDAGRVALERDAPCRGRRLVASAKDRVAQRRHPTRPTMRALIASGGGTLRWQKVPAPPAPGPDAAVVRPIAVATCDMDRPLALGATPFPLPLSMGHECIAEVLRVGDKVGTVRPGQRVVVPFQISCGECGKCRAGFTSNCAAVPPVSMYGFGVGGGHWGGALAEQLAVPYADAMLVPLPDGIDPVAAASLSDTLCEGYRHVGPHLPRLLTGDPETEVLIVAALNRRTLYSASSPLYAGQVALALGAWRVRLVDTRPWVRSLATELGIEALPPSELRGIAPSALVVAATATSRGLWLALSKTAPDGVCSSVGGLFRSGRVPAAQMYGRNATLHVSRTNARVLLPDALALLTSGRWHPERVTTTVGRLEDAPRLLGAHYRGGDIKTILHT